MLKKIKIILTIIIMSITLFSFKSVNAAYSVEIDPNSNIGLPDKIYFGTGTISIRYIEQSYDLYYQFVEMEEEDYQQIKEGRDEISSMQEELTALDTELSELTDIYEEAEEAYNAKLETGVQDEELEILEAEMNEALANVNTKSEEIDSKSERYENRFYDIVAIEENLTPSFIEQNWIKTEDGKFTTDTLQFSEDKSFVLWAKLVLEDGTTIYDFRICRLPGTNVDDTDTPSGDTQTGEGSANSSSDKTTSTSILPKTGTNLIIVTGIFVLALLSIIFHKKYNKYKSIK